MNQASSYALYKTFSLVYWNGAVVFITAHDGQGLWLHVPASRAYDDREDRVGDDHERRIAQAVCDQLNQEYQEGRRYFTERDIESAIIGIPKK